MLTSCNLSGQIIVDLFQKSNQTRAMAHPVKNITCSSISMTSKSAVSCPPSPSRANLYAQELNNSAALCIEVGLFDRAIVSLKRALKLYKYQEKTQHVDQCNSYEYTLEGCIIGTRELKRTSQQNNSIPCEDSFISKQPILLPARGRTTMGPALLLIITHNLGLAHHLVAVGCEGSECTKNVRYAMASYNVAYQSQTTLIEHQHMHKNQAEAASIRSNQFKMIILNNMSHLHKLNTDEIKHNHCLQMLLPIIMLVVDQQGLTTSITETSSSRIELEGFLNNIAPLILSAKYAADTA